MPTAARTKPKPAPASKRATRSAPPAPPASAPLPPLDAAPPQVALRTVDSLIPYARNARTHSEEQIAQLSGSIAEFGWTNPILADERGIVAGHGRLMAARKLYDAGQRVRLPDGRTLPIGTVPVIDCSGWPDAKRRAYVLADNKLALAAGWDSALLLAELDALVEDGIDVAMAGFSVDEIAAMRDGWQTDFAAVDRTLAAASRCRLVVSAPVEAEPALRAALEAAIASSGIADVEIE